MDKIRRFIVVEGIVQGVGFRPFVYKLAIKNNLKGWVNNTSIGVLIDIEGKEENINYFITMLKNNPPALSKINTVKINKRDIINFKGFTIKNSDNTIKPSTYISPDYCICDDCIREIFDKNNRRYRYPFTNCTNCGPRFTIIKELPYDRRVTTMNEFKMCNSCKEEYESPINRRFHAQPNGCSNCGPKVFLVNKYGDELKGHDVISETIKLLKEGSIFAIKGLGGYNLACDCKNEDSIKILRERKRRPSKPLAVMMKDVTTVKKYCEISLKEEEILTSNKRPILLLNKKKEFNLPKNLAPNNKRLGVMLPYTPMHYLLFEDDIEALVMTSANISGEPMIYKNNEAIEKLKNIVDYYLMNNRDIYISVDDSVTVVIDEIERVIRSGRGYSPMALSINTKEEILALGSELKNTFSLSNKKDIFISEYIGDLKEVNTLKSLEKSLNHFIDTYEIKPKLVALDMHPDFIYKDLDVLKEVSGNKFIEVQHHHGHIVSCMAENYINDKVIGIAFDGTGYGSDKKIWGGEFLICDKKEFNRVGHLEYFKLPGGESAIKEPWKIAISLLYKVYGDEFEDYLPRNLKNKNYNIIKKMIDKNINSPETSSVGRLFDGISALIGFDKKVTYEGEAAIYLEHISDEFIEEFYKYDINKSGDNYILSFNNIIKGIIYDISNSIEKEIIAKKFHNTIIKSTTDISLNIIKEFDINKIALSGGVFQNEILLNGITKALKKYGITVLTHKNIPCNDSGISFGQLIIANESIKGE